MKKKLVQMNSKEDVQEIIRLEYGKIAVTDGSCCGASSCCGNPSPEILAKAIGYSIVDLTEIPDSANMGLSCGNPTALASLKPGEVVLDLGAGGGFDAFIAARIVGEKGRVIGVDMTSEMVLKARQNAKSFNTASGLYNVEFRLGEIEHLPVGDAMIDVVISNCVLNLSPDKSQVWKEIARVIKPGGRVCISDMVLLRPLPEEIRDSIIALVGCISGASSVDEIRKYIRDAGLREVSIDRNPDYIDQMTRSQSQLYKNISTRLPEDTNLGDFVTSLTVKAEKSQI